jgi:tellurite methyltransferase
VPAGFSLPFVPPAQVPPFWERVLSATPGGLLVVNLFGVHDEWAQEPDMSFHSRTEVETLTSDTR